jgi:hypothetical protein
VLEAGKSTVGNSTRLSARDRGAGQSPVRDVVPKFTWQSAQAAPSTGSRVTL